MPALTQHNEDVNRLNYGRKGRKQIKVRKSRKRETQMNGRRNGSCLNELID
jgi:hypothetical protein